MKFFDANILYGVPSQKRLYELVPDCATLLLKLKEFGIEKAMVRREEQFFNSPITANAMLSDDVSKTDNLWGVWTMLPPHCGEMPSPENILSLMKKNRIAGWQFFPVQNKYVFHKRVLKQWFSLAEKCNIPLYIDFAFVPEKDLLDVMDEFQDLTVILRNMSVWPPDRILRPFMSEFPNAYMELSFYLVPDGIENLVSDGFAERMLFSTRFQASHVGGPMMMLKHASIAEDKKSLIASGNMERILERIDYDNF